jgi:hypothetical protein
MTLRALAAVAVAAGGGLFSYDVTAPLVWRAAGTTDTRDGVTVRDVSFLSPKLGRVRAYLVLPPGDGPFPTSVLIQNGSRDPLTRRAELAAFAKTARTTVHYYAARHPLNEQAYADRAAFLVRALT